MKNILLGVTGSVATIKTRQLAESLRELGKVKVVATHHAQYFMQADSEALKEQGISIFTDSAEWPTLTERYDLDAPILHIEMRRWADCLVISPLDANTLAKLSNGICDNLLTSVFRAWDWQRPVVLCPAMNTLMWNNPPTATQLQTLRSWGAVVVDPVEKQLACKDVGMGAMASVEAIVQAVTWATGVPGSEAE